MRLDDGVGLDNVWIYTDKQKCVLIYAGNIGGRNYMYMWKSRDGRKKRWLCVRATRRMRDVSCVWDTMDNKQRCDEGRDPFS